MFFLISYLVAALSAVAYSVAPGDEDSFCRGLSGSIVPPEFPTNTKILLDSFNYRNLLPPHALPAAVWQVVDNDDNNIQGGATTWLQNSNRPCRQSVNVCGFEQGTQDNWAITQYINRTVNGTRLPQVSVLVEFQLGGCPTEQNCQRTFVLDKYETSTVDNTLARDTSNYLPFSRVAPTDDSGQNLQNHTSELDFDTDEEGFYLALRDETTCIVISRVTVFYNVCPQETESFVIRPEILAPQIDRKSPSLDVAAECVEGAIPENGVGARLICSQGGVWNTVPNTGCRCDSRFLASEDQRNCTSCPVCMYLSVVNEECRVCPENSEGVQSGLTVCPCVEGHYREPGEEDFPCTCCPVSMYLSVVNQECYDCPENSEGVQSGLTVCPCVEGYYRAPGEEDLPCTGTSQFPEAVIITVSVLAVALIVVISVILVFVIWYKMSNKRNKVTVQSPTEEAPVYHQDNMELQENVAYQKAHFHDNMELQENVAYQKTHFSVSDRNCSMTYATVS